MWKGGTLAVCSLNLRFVSNFFFNALNDLKELEERFFQFAVLKFKQEVLFDPRSLNLNLHPERSRSVKAHKLWVCRLV